MKKIKNHLLAGILIWLPIALTIWILSFIINFATSVIPHQLNSEYLFNIHIPGSEIIFAVVLLLVTGMIATNILGQKLFDLGNKLILHIPIVKSIYKGVKQVSDTLLSDSGNAFRQALLVRFPNHNTWTIAFITGKPFNGVFSDDIVNNFINVYIPTTPNPTSGYFIMVKKEDCLDLDLSVDEALRYVISMGTINPKTPTN
ncbi:MAG: DUF502 domain-containing protein [Burkholderiales bacterium]|nr:DUF502 domain-containing protein [Burkholderiales bacterium]